MEHDKVCEREAIVRAIDIKLRLSPVEKIRLRDDLVVELCFCWDRRIDAGFSMTMLQAQGRTARGIGVVMENRGLGYKGSWERLTSWSDRVKEVEKVDELIESSNVILVDFKKGRRID